MLVLPHARRKRTAANAARRAMADFRFVLRLLDAHFLQHFHGRHAGFFKVPGHGLVDALRLDEFHEPKLRGFVAVFILRAALHHHARPRLQHRATDQRTVVGEHLRHPQLDSDNSVDRHCLFSLCRSMSFTSEIGCVLRAILTFLSTFNCRLSTYFPACPKALISTSTPGGKSSFINASTVSGVGSRISMSRLCVRISNCSRDFLSTCGERSTVQRLMVVGKGIGPATSAPVRLAVSTISRVD